MSDHIWSTTFNFGLLLSSGTFDALRRPIYQLEDRGDLIETHKNFNWKKNLNSGHFFHFVYSLHSFLGHNIKLYKPSVRLSQHPKPLFQPPCCRCFEQATAACCRCLIRQFVSKSDWTRMWANAQRDGRPAEYRWRPLFNAAKFGWRPLLKCRAVTLPRRETRWNYLGCPKLTKRSQPLVGRSSPYCEDM